jgi:hypothetical protein
MNGIAIGVSSVLVVSHSGTAYVAAFLSVLTAALASAWAAHHRHPGTARTPALSVLLLSLMVGAIVVTALGGGFMAERLRQVSPDPPDQQRSWSSGLALRDDGPATALFGMGLDNYPRIILARKPDERFPSNFVAVREGGYRFLLLHTGLPTYLEQNVPVQPDQPYRLFVARRSPDGKGVLSVIPFERILLHSANCRDTTFRSHIAGMWEDFGAKISSARLDQDALPTWFKSPVDLALFDPVPGSTVEIGHARSARP